MRNNTMGLYRNIRFVSKLLLSVNTWLHICSTALLASIYYTIPSLNPTLNNYCRSYQHWQFPGSDPSCKV